MPREPVPIDRHTHTPQHPQVGVQGGGDPSPPRGKIRHSCKIEPAAPAPGVSQFFWSVLPPDLPIIFFLLFYLCRQCVVVVGGGGGDGAGVAGLVLLLPLACVAVVGVGGDSAGVAGSVPSDWPAVFPPPSCTRSDLCAGVLEKPAGKLPG